MLKHCPGKGMIRSVGQVLLQQAELTCPSVRGEPRPSDKHLPGAKLEAHLIRVLAAVESMYVMETSAT